MAGLADADTIDLVAQDADGQFMVVMVEDRPWGTDGAQPMQLREKINAYAGFILDGDLAVRYPETSGQPVRVQLDCVEEPTDDIAVIINHAEAQLAGMSIGFRVHVRH